MWFTWKLHATCNKSFCKVREKEREVRHEMTWWQAINSIRCKHDDQPYIDHTNNLGNCATFIPLSNIVRVTEFWRWFFSLFLSSTLFYFFLPFSLLFCLPCCLFLSVFILFALTFPLFRSIFHSFFSFSLLLSNPRVCSTFSPKFSSLLAH